jgi:hypothetical protein
MTCRDGHSAPVRLARRGTRAGCWRTAGPATCASCATRWTTRAASAGPGPVELSDLPDGLQRRCATAQGRPAARRRPGRGPAAAAARRPLERGGRGAPAGLRPHDALPPHGPLGHPLTQRTRRRTTAALTHHDHPCPRPVAAPAGCTPLPRCPAAGGACRPGAGPPCAWPHPPRRPGAAACRRALPHRVADQAGGDGGRTDAGRRRSARPGHAGRPRSCPRCAACAWPTAAWPCPAPRCAT